jgi:hypothetical protein
MQLKFPLTLKTVCSFMMFFDSYNLNYNYYAIQRKKNKLQRGRQERMEDWEERWHRRGNFSIVAILLYTSSWEEIHNLPFSFCRAAMNIRKQQGIISQPNMKKNWQNLFL